MMCMPAIPSRPVPNVIYLNLQEHIIGRDSKSATRLPNKMWESLIVDFFSALFGLSFSLEGAKEVNNRESLIL